LDNESSNVGNLLVARSWRRSVFGLEVMVGALFSNTPQPLSAITIQAMADFGYPVDLDAADEYTLSSSDAAAALASGPVSELMSQIEWKIDDSIILLDEKGRIVREIKR